MKKNKSKLFLSILMGFAFVIMCAGALFVANPKTIVHAEAEHSHSGWTKWNNMGALPTSAGNYYLVSDVQLDTWTAPSGETNICLNGCKISPKYYISSHGWGEGTGTLINTSEPPTPSLIIVKSNATLNFYDETGSGKLFENSGYHRESSYNGRDSSVTVNGGTLNIYGGCIELNNSLEVKSNGVLNIYGGSFQGSTNSYEVSYYNIDAIKLTGGEVNMFGGTIKSAAGTGVDINSGTFNMNGGTITECRDYGIYNNGTFNMNGGTISNNKDGICNDKDATITSGNITQNKNTGITNNNENATLSLKNSTIKDNIGYGLYAQKGSFSVGGKVIVENNGTKFSSSRNIVIGFSSSKLKLNEELNMSSKIGITLLGENGESICGTFTYDGTESLKAKDFKDYFFSDEGYIVGESEFELMFSEFMYRGEEYSAWRTAALPASAGNYYLVDDLVISETWIVPNGITKLYLYGKKLTGAGTSTISVGGNATLIVYDLQDDTGIITNDSDNGTIINISNGGKVELWNGTIKGGAACGVNVADGTLELNHHDDETDDLATLGALITQNGYGIKTNRDSQVLLKSCRITKNRIGGVYAAGQIAVEASPVVDENGTKGNIILAFYTNSANERIYQKLAINNALTSGAKMGITIEGIGNEDCSGIFTKTNTSLIVVRYISYFFSDNQNCMLKSRGNELKIGIGRTIEIQGADHGSINTVVEFVQTNIAMSGDNVQINIEAEDGYHLKNIYVAYTRDAVRTIPGLVSLMGDAVFAGDNNTSSLICKINDNKNFVLMHEDEIVAELTNAVLNIPYEGFFITDACDGYVWSFKTESSKITNITVMFNGITVYNSQDGQISTGSFNSDVKITTIRKYYSYSFTVPFEDVTIHAEFEKNLGVQYMKWEGTIENGHFVETTLDEDYLLVTRDTPTTKLYDIGSEKGIKWIFVSENYTFNSNIEIFGTANIILKDGVSFTAQNIVLKEGNTLNIYSQKQGTGELTLVVKTGFAPAIGTNTTNGHSGILNVYGGIITADAERSYRSAGIGGGVSSNGNEVNIYGGEIRACGEKCGIDYGYSNGNINVANGYIIFGGDRPYSTDIISSPYETRYEWMYIKKICNVEISINDLSIEYNAEIPTDFSFVAKINGEIVEDEIILSKISNKLSLTTNYTQGLGKGEYRIFNQNENYGEGFFNTVYKSGDPYSSYYMITSLIEGTLVVNGVEPVEMIDPTAKQNLVYTGEAQALVNAGSIDNGEVWYKLGDDGEYSTQIPTATDAGIYKIYFKGVGDINHKDTDENSLYVIIEKVNIEFTAPVQHTGLTYIGRNQNIISIEEFVGGTVWYKLGEKGEYSLDVPQATLCGTYTIYYKVVGDNNHNDIEEAMVQTTINPNDKTLLRLTIYEANDYYDNIVSSYPSIAQTLYNEIQNAEYVANNDNIVSAQINYQIGALQNAIETAEVEIVKTKIDAIGEVEFTNECLEKIYSAYEAYLDLSDEEQERVTNYATLVSAQEKYAQLEVDHAAANIVIMKINSIGVITYVGKTNPKIEEARTAFNALTINQKMLVVNYNMLLTAENTYNALKAANEVTKLIDETNKVTIKTQDGITIPNSVELNVEETSNVSAEEGSADYIAITEMLGENEKIAKVYNIKLVDENGEEIQPNDIEEGMTITLRLALPQGVSTSGLKILHIHSANDMEYVENYSVEGNNVVFNVNRLSEFAFVTTADSTAENNTPTDSINNSNVLDIIAIVLSSVAIVSVCAILICYFVVRKKRHNIIVK